MGPYRFWAPCDDRAMHERHIVFAVAGYRTVLYVGAGERVPCSYAIWMRCV